MLRKLLISIAAVLGLSVAGTAAAMTQTFAYGFVPGPSHLEGELAGPPPVALAPATGSASLSLDVDQNGNPVEGGAATLESLSFDIDYGAAGYPAAGLGVSGSLQGVLLNPVPTTWSGGTLAPLSGTLHLSGTITCSTTATCAYLGMPPSTTLDTDASLSPSIEAGPAYFSATVPLGTAPGSGTLYLTTVPEPGTLVLFAAGLAGLVAAGRWRRS